MRRSFILAFAAAFSFTVLAQQPTPPPANPPATPKPAINPDTLWNKMLQGNKLFAAGTISYDTLKEERLELKDYQIPPVTVLSCSDSRVPPELVFNQSLGAIFGIRTAGNVADEFGVASIEFAIINGWTKLIVVLGHESCGAVKGALGGGDPVQPALAALAKRVRTSFIGIPYDSRDPANVKRAIELNAHASAAHLLASSITIRDAVLTERVKLITAYYDFGTGEVKTLP